MSEEPTRDMSGERTFQDRVLAEFAGINTQLTAIRGDIAGLDARLTSVEQLLTTVDERLSKLEDRVDTRLMETRPIWEAVLAKIDRLDEKFDTVIQDIYEARTDIRQHAKRLTEVKRRLNH